MVAAPWTPSKRRSWPKVVLAAVVAIAVVLGAAVGSVIVTTDEPTRDASSRGGTSRTTPEDEASRETTVAELERFVEKARGLAFKQPVKVTLLPDREFRARLDAQIAKDRTEADIADAKVLGRVLVALGLLDKGVDVESALDDLYGGAVLGYYDPELDELFVRGDDLRKVSVRSTLVHELTHALQDQHFELHRPELDERDDEAATGFQGLAEGDAVRVENLYLETLSLADQKQGERESAAQSARVGSDVPEVLAQLVVFPYQVGPSFAGTLVARGGQARLDAAFAAPPTTTEHLLHPDRFLDADMPKAVAPPSADGPEIDAGVMGELVLRLLLATELTPSRAGVASTGWGGDRYVAWESRGRTCVRTAVVTDTDADRRELRDALVEWTRAQPEARLADRADGAITFTACA